LPPAAPPLDEVVFTPPLLPASFELLAPEFDEQPNAVIAAKANPTHGRRVNVTKLMSFLLAGERVWGNELGDLGAALAGAGAEIENSEQAAIVYPAAALVRIAKSSHAAPQCPPTTSTHLCAGDVPCRDRHRRVYALSLVYAVGVAYAIWPAQDQDVGTPITSAPVYWR
jgi:hypothetical protein